MLKYIEYTFLGILILSQFAFFNETKFKKRIEELVKGSLAKELKKIPSKSLIIKRQGEVVTLRGSSIAITVMFIISIIIYYQKI